MAEQQSIPDSPTPHEMGHHMRDYGRFTTMFKWGAILSFLTGLIVIVFVL